MSFLGLPQEIHDLIAGLLTRQNKAQCLRVCKDWKLIFLPTLYAKLQLKEKMAKKLWLKPHHRTCCLSMKKMGRYVQSFSIYSHELIPCEKWEDLFLWCPGIEELGVSSCLWNALKKHNQDLSLLKSLTVNTLRASLCLTNILTLALTRLSIRNVDKQDLLVLLVELPQLVTLEIQKLSPVKTVGTLNLTFEDIEAIHATCKMLKSLKLMGLTLRGVPSSQKVVYSRLRHLHLRSVKVTDPEWFSFFAIRYPSQVSVCIQVIRCPWNIQLDKEMILRFYHRWSQIAAGSLWPNLQSLSLLNITDNIVIFDTKDVIRLLAPCYQLTSLKIIGSSNFPYDLKLDLTWILKNFVSLKTLHLQTVKLSLGKSSFVHTQLTRFSLSEFQHSSLPQGKLQQMCPNALYIILT